MTNYFGRKIRTRREELGRSQEYIGKIMKIENGQPHVSEWERGLYLPADELLGRLASALEWSYDELVKDTEFIEDPRRKALLPIPRSPLYSKIAERNHRNPELPSTASIALGRKIRSRRMELGLTEMAIGKAIGYRSHGIISAWSAGISLPTQAVLPALSAALHMSVDELLEGTGFVVSDLKARPKIRVVGDPIPQQFFFTNPCTYRLGNGKLMGNIAPGSIEGFYALVSCDADYDTVSLEWAAALIETHTGFANTDPHKALAYLQKKFPSWNFNPNEPPLIEPELS